MTTERDQYLADRRRMFGELLKATGREITLVPRTKVDKPAGGTAWVEGTPRAPQDFRIKAPSSVPPQVVESGTGTQIEASLLLIGEHTAVIAKDDMFDLDGHRWLVTQVLHENEWERRAEVIRFAG